MSVQRTFKRSTFSKKTNYLPRKQNMIETSDTTSNGLNEITLKSTLVVVTLSFLLLQTFKFHSCKNLSKCQKTCV